MKKQYAVSLDEEIRLEAQRLAEKNGMTFSSLVRWLISRELQKEKEKCKIK